MNLNDTFRSLHYPLPPDIQRLIGMGDLSGAARLIDRALEGDVQPELRGRLLCERERVSRLPGEFPRTLQETRERFREQWPDMIDERFQALMDDGRIDWRYIDGHIRCGDRCLESCRLYPGLTGPGWEEEEDTRERDEALSRMRERGGLGAVITLRASIRSVEAAAGRKVQAWLPIPSPRFQHSGVEILRCTPSGIPGPESAPQRTIYWLSRERDDFSVTYRCRVRAPWVDLSAPPLRPAPALPRPCPELAEEPPHIRFTPMLRQLAERLTHGLEAPLDKARAVYGYVTENVDYRYQPSYFQLPPIAEMAASGLRGDCGVMAILFITLCRISGVPALWQSGLYVRPDGASSHDWAMFYAPPYGWLWCDPSFGSSARRKGDEERREHYFGNLDPWRMAANHALCAPLSPPDEAWRIDPVDNQRGEMAVDGRGLRAEEVRRDVQVLEFEYLPE